MVKLKSAMFFSALLSVFIGVTTTTASAQHIAPPTHSATPAHSAPAQSAVTVVLSTTKESDVELPVTPSEALARLKEGNERFVNNSLRVVDLKAERAKLILDQHPYAIVLACADSRVSPDVLFDEKLGRLFVIRVAGNVVDSVVLGSIEYAAEHLSTNLLLVLGHESCSAVHAALTGAHLSPNIDALLAHISVPVKKVQAKRFKDDSVMEAAVEENVRFQMQDALASSSVLTELVRSKELGIVGGVYNLHNGRVEFLKVDLHLPAQTITTR